MRCPCDSPEPRVLLPSASPNPFLRRDISLSVPTKDAAARSLLVPRPGLCWCPGWWTLQGHLACRPLGLARAG